MLLLTDEILSIVGSLGYWVFDQNIQQALSNHIDGINSKKKDVVYFVKTDIAIFLRDELLKVNPYCKTLNFVGNYIQSLEDETDLQYVMQNQKKLFAKLKSEVEYFDVANIAIDRATGGKLLSVTLKAGGTKSININSNEYEALSYPLFYQHGEIGWGDFDSKYIAYNKYLASRLLKPELKSYGCNPYTLGPDFLTASHKSDYCEIDNDQFERQINTNRFQLCPRLMQVFAVDMTSRQIDRKLNFVARNQDTLKMKNKLNDF